MTTTPAAPRLGPADAATLTLTMFSLGVTLQVLLIESGTSALRAFVASAVIFSATSQFAYLAVRSAGGSDGAAIVAGIVVATRFGILAASLVRRLGGPRWQRVLAAVTVLDPAVAMAVQQPTPGEVSRQYWRTMAALLVGWFAGITAGSLLGDVLGDTRRWGLDALFPAALLAIIGPSLHRRENLLAAVTGALVCVALIPVAPAGLPIILSVTGVAVAMAATRERRPS